MHIGVYILKEKDNQNIPYEYRSVSEKNNSIMRVWFMGAHQLLLSG